MIPVLKEKEIIAILREYGVNKVDEIKRIDSSRGEKDIRLNYIVDKKYVLRINSAEAMTEERLQELERLMARRPRRSKMLRITLYILCSGTV